jgi:hypothetical protein
MQQANVRVDAPHNLAIEFQYEAQNSMRCRVLRPKIDGEVAVCCAFHNRSRWIQGKLPSSQGVPSLHAPRGELHCGATFDDLGRVISATLTVSDASLPAVVQRPNGIEYLKGGP